LSLAIKKLSRRWPAISSSITTKLTWTGKSDEVDTGELEEDWDFFMARIIPQESVLST
jgi:hypothetical protein